MRIVQMSRHTLFNMSKSCVDLHVLSLFYKEYSLNAIFFLTGVDTLTLNCIFLCLIALANKIIVSARDDDIYYIIKVDCLYPL